jgi:cardiolipin synthase A/B
VHNKGVIVDGKRVLVSSINWNENSPSYNREAGLIIDHTGAAGYFTGVFDCDWDSSARGNDPAVPGSYVSASPGTEDLRNYIAVGIVVLFAVLYLIRRMRI